MRIAHSRQVEPMLREMFLEGMSRAAATVSVVTTDGPAGRAGVTVSSMTAVSADSATPSLLICINEQSRAADAIRSNGVFCVNVLRDDQTYVSNIFAGRNRSPANDRFAAGEWRLLNSPAPALKGALVSFDCAVKRAFKHGTHWVFIGELAEMALNDGNSPLIYANRGYGRSVPLRPMQAAAGDGNCIKLGCSMHSAPFFIGSMIRAFGAQHPDIKIELFEGTQPELVAAIKSNQIQLAITHAHALDPAVRATHLHDLRPYCIIPEAHPFADAASVTLSQLSAEPLVLLDTPPTSSFIMNYFSFLPKVPKACYKVHSMELVRSLVANGLGYSILFTKPANNMSYDGKALASLQIADSVSGLPLALIENPDLDSAATKRPLATFCRNFFAQS